MPMLARSAPSLPAGDGGLYEPKLDGFRALVHFDGRRLHIDSRNGKTLDTYFPDLVSRLPTALRSPRVRRQACTSRRGRRASPAATLKRSRCSEPATSPSTCLPGEVALSIVHS